MISEQRLDRFLDELASAAPTPGGGSAAAIMGAMGAALASMVCNLTIGKKGYEAVEGEMREALREAERLRALLTSMVADDVRAFDRLMASYKLPKATPDEQAARSAAIQDALKLATDVPLACAQACFDVIAVAQRIAATGNKGVISDAGVATLAAHAALRSAGLNVEINVPSIKDDEFVRTRRARLEQLLAGGASASERTFDTVRGRLG